MPTKDRTKLRSLETFIFGVNSRTQILKLEENVRYFGLKYLVFNIINTVKMR